MSSFRVRPKFTIYSSKSTEDIIHDTKKHLAESDAEVRGLAMQDHITLRILPEDRHFWSPQVSILLIEENDRTKLIGTYGPMPNVWVIFAFSYLALFTLLIFTSIVGFSQKNLGIESNILWALPFLTGGILALYFISQFGQKLGAAQMFTLHHQIEKITGQKIPIY